MFVVTSINVISRMSKMTMPKRVVFLVEGKSSSMRISPSYPRAFIAVSVRSP